LFDCSLYCPLIMRGEDVLEMLGSGRKCTRQYSDVIYTILRSAESQCEQRKLTVLTRGFDWYQSQGKWRPKSGDMVD
jgi:hypothetical protein